MIKFLIMDVDGTLTDGKIYMGNSGELFKSFNVKDGCGIKDILPDYDIIPIVITARESEILRRRCEELNISCLFQGVRKKYDKLNEVIKAYNEENSTHYTLENCAYIGDDILDLQCMKPIREAGGIVGCPDDAVEKVKKIADYVSSHDGGSGAVRDFIDWIVEVCMRANVNE